MKQMTNKKWFTPSCVLFDIVEINCDFLDIKISLCLQHFLLAALEMPFNLLQ